MKRFITFFLTIIMLFALCACNGKVNETVDTPVISSAAPDDNTPTTGDDPEDPSVNSTLVFDADDYAAYETGAAKDIVFLRGTWYEMGQQYVQQAPNAVVCQVTRYINEAEQMYGSFDDAWVALQTRLEYYEENAPELLDFYRGIAEESDFPYEQVIVAFMYFSGSLCNGETAWGDATGGKAYFAVNSDMTYLNEYIMPVMMMYPEDPAYPEDQYSFAYINGRGFNSLGLVAGGTGGQGAVDGDDGDSGFAKHREDMLIPARCATAEEAKDMFLNNCKVEAGYNFITIDSTGLSYVVENTKQEQVVREPNKSIEGNRDYFIVTNNYVEEEMQEHIYPDGSFDDCPVRYATIKSFLERDYGKITLDTFIEAQACTTYIDPASGSMTADISWNNDITSYFSPSNVAPNEKSTDRLLIDATDAVMYIMSGNQNTLLSALPNATGTYCRISLKGEPLQIASECKDYAQLYIYQAEKEIYQSGNQNDSQISNLNVAKAMLIQGDRYLDLAKFAEDKTTSLLYFGKAATYFCEAQCLAKAAWNNPHTVYSDYDGQFPY